MPIHRTDKSQGGYSILDNTGADDGRLSWEARGVLWHLLTKPDDWQVNRYGLIAIGPAGETVVRRIMQELTRCGYISQELKREGGKFKYIIHVYESPRINPAVMAAMSLLGEATAVTIRTGGLIPVGQNHPPVTPQPSTACGKPYRIVITESLINNNTTTAPAHAHPPTHESAPAPVPACEVDVGAVPDAAVEGGDNPRKLIGDEIGMAYSKLFPGKLEDPDCREDLLKQIQQHTPERVLAMLVKARVDISAPGKPVTWGYVKGMLKKDFESKGQSNGRKYTSGARTPKLTAESQISPKLARIRANGGFLPKQPPEPDSVPVLRQ